MANGIVLRAWAFALAGALSCRASDPLAPNDPRGPAMAGNVEGQTLRELEIAAALPLARRGVVFRVAWLDQHFRAQPWYRPTGFDARLLPSEERARSDAMARSLRTLPRVELERRQRTLDARQRRRRASCTIAVASGQGNAMPSAATVVLVLDALGLQTVDLASGTIRRVPATPGQRPAWAPSIAVSAEQGHVLSVQEVNGTAQVARWEAATLRPLPPFQALDVLHGYGSPSDGYALGRDGTLVLALALERKTWTLFSLGTDEPVLSLPAAPIFTAASRIAVSADRRRVVATTSDGPWLWRVPSGQDPGDLAVADAPVPLPRAADADLSPDGRWIAGVGGPASTWLLEADAAGQPLSFNSSSRSERRFVAFSPDGRKLMAGTGALGLTIWEVPSGRVLYEQSEEAALECARQWAVFLPGSDAVALAGEAGGLEVLDLRTGSKRTIAADAKFGNPREDRIEAALLARALGRKDDTGVLRELSYEEQPLLLEARLSEEELAQWHDRGKDLRVVEALIHARRGRRFRSPRWQALAEAQPWYRSDSDFSDARLTPTDRANLALVKRITERVEPRPPAARPDPASGRTPSDFPVCPAGSAPVRRTLDARDAGRSPAGKRESMSCVSRRDGLDVSHGPEWVWFVNGRLELTHAFVDGVEHGEVTSYYFAGSRKQMGKFLLGKREGAWLSYHRNGVISEQAGYEGGSLQGPRRRWFEGGGAALESTYRGGVPDGAWTSFYDDGHAAVVLAFRAGRVQHTRGSVEGYLPDGQRWPSTVHHAICTGPAPCGTPLEKMEFDSLPPLLAEPCATSPMAASRQLPRGAWLPVLEAAKRAWPTDAGGGTVPGPGACVDQLTVTCAPNLDGVPGPEVLAEISYRILVSAGRDCSTAQKSDAWEMRAVVALSPPEAAGARWRTRGLVGYPRCTADVCRGDERLDGFVWLPGGHAGVRIAVTSSGGACGFEEWKEIRTLREGAWMPVLRETSRRCGQPVEPEEDDVF
jgi:hypothetical protein